METYKNDYSKNEDFLLWELHEIRNKINVDSNSIEKINNNSIDLIKNYGLGNLRIVKNRNVN